MGRRPIPHPMPFGSVLFGPHRVPLLIRLKAGCIFESAIEWLRKSENPTDGNLWGLLGTQMDRLRDI